MELPVWALLVVGLLLLVLCCQQLCQMFNKSEGYNGNGSALTSALQSKIPGEPFNSPAGLAHAYGASK